LTGEGKFPLCEKKDRIKLRGGGEGNHSRKRQKKEKVSSFLRGEEREGKTKEKEMSDVLRGRQGTKEKGTSGFADQCRGTAFCWKEKNAQ